MRVPGYVATASRVLGQLRNDHRTVGLMLFVPGALVGLFAWLFSGGPQFQGVGPVVLALFPFVVMFIVTSIATLRERTTGTLERLMTTPISKADIIVGYALAFSGVAVIQTALTVTFAITVCGLNVSGPIWQLFVCAIVNSIMGTALGLLTSAFARTEFQAVQFLPLVVFPQMILGGVFMDRSRMPRALEIISDFMPLTYSIKAVKAVAAGLGGGDLGWPLLVVAACAVAFLVIGSFTLSRRTP